TWTCAVKKCNFANNFGWRRTCYCCGADKPDSDASGVRSKGDGGAGKGAAAAKDDKLEDEQIHAFLALDDVQFSAPVALLPSQLRSRIVAQRAVKSGDPSAVSKEAKQDHDFLKAKVAKTANALDKAKDTLSKQVLRVVQVQAEHDELQAKGNDAAKRAAEAHGQLSGGVAVPEASVLVDFEKLIAARDSVVDQRQQAAQDTKAPSEAADTAGDARDGAGAGQPLLVNLESGGDAKRGDLSFSDLDGDWADKLVNDAGGGAATEEDSEGKWGITQQAVQAALEEVERAKKARCSITEKDKSHL
ncbi:unnamed protein product, partial [Prorocentrum cordatum]